MLTSFLFYSVIANIYSSLFYNLLSNFFIRINLNILNIIPAMFSITLSLRVYQLFDGIRLVMCIKLMLTVIKIEPVTFNILRMGNKF